MYGASAVRVREEAVFQVAGKDVIGSAEFLPEDDRWRRRRLGRT